MSYFIIETADASVTVWDGISRDPDHPGEKAGIMTLFVGEEHGYETGDEVDILVRKKEFTTE